MESTVAKAAIGLCVAMLLAACSNTQTKPGTAFDRIDEEIRQMPGERARTGRPDAVDRALLPPVASDLPKEKPVETRFDLVVNNAPASQVFMAIVSGTRYSMVLHPELGGTLTLNLKDVTVREALDTIRELYGYDYKVQGTRILVQSNALQTRLFQINYLASRRAGMSSTRVFSGSVTSSGSSTSTGTSGTGSTNSSQSRILESANVETTHFNDFWLDIAESMGGLLGCEVRHSQESAGAGGGSGGGSGALTSRLASARTNISCKEGRNLIVNQQAGVLMVRGMPAELRAIEDYLKATQLIVERQVMLEAKILEVQLKDGFQSGINWTRFNDSGSWRWSVGSDTSNLNFDGSQVAGSTIGSTLGGGILGATGRNESGLFGLAFRTTSFAMLLQFLESQGNVQVLSSPRIATLNNQKAVLKVGVDEFFVTGISSSTTTSTTGTTTGTTSAPTITLQPFFSGIALDVTPQIDEEGNIMLHVHPSISTVAEKTKTIHLGSMGIYQLPLATSAVNETDSIVRVPDGRIVAIGGLMKESQFDDKAQIPGAGEIPLLGAFFGNRGKGYTKREIVVLIKPTIIRGDSQWQQDLDDTRGRMREYDPRKVAPPQQ